MGVILLVIVTWSLNAPPTAQVFVTAGRQQCSSLAAPFIESEEAANANNPFPVREHYAVSCEQKNGNDRFGA